MIQQKTPKKIKGERKKRAAERKALQAKAAEIEKIEADIFNANVLKNGSKYFIKNTALSKKGAEAFRLVHELASRGIAEVEILSDEQWDIMAHGEKSPYYKKEKGDGLNV